MNLRGKRRLGKLWAYMRATTDKSPKYGELRGKWSPLGPLLCLVIIATNGLNATQPSMDFSTLMSVLSARYGTSATQRGTAWQSTLKDLDAKSVPEQLTGINRFFNQSIRWQSDEEIYGETDFWATPAETLGLGRGDCEDFTIAK